VPPSGRPTVAPQQPVPALVDPWADPPPGPRTFGPMAPIDGKQAAQDAVRAVGGAAAGVYKFFGDNATSQAIQKSLNPVVLAPTGASQARQYDHYKRMLEARGFTLDPTNPTVVGLRGLDSTGAQHATTAAPRYDDTLVVLTKDASGREHVTTFAGSTHPGQTRPLGEGVSVPDVNHDGVSDVGMINAGEYSVVPHADHAGNTAWAIHTVGGSDSLPGVRDTNHDGVYSAAERQASETRTPQPDTLGGVLIHQGGTDVPWSLGCVNMSQNRDVYPQFIQAVGGHDSSMKLVILDKNAD